jgi:hypothetical protein
VRVSLIEIGFVTGVLLLITVPHFGEFPPPEFPVSLGDLLHTRPAGIGADLVALAED